LSIPTVQPALPPWWLDEAEREGADPPAPALDGDAIADVCVIGGGFTGLWTALALRAREPAARIVLLEADRCGAGPSGRNGGFLHGYWASLAGLRTTLGDVRAIEVARAGEAIIPAVRALGADVWLREGGMLMVSTTPSQDEAIDAAAPATFSRSVIEEIIRGNIGFDGVLISDDISMGALVGGLGDRTRRALDAGCDIALHCTGVLAEMEEVAGASSPLSPQAQTRIARGETLRLASQQEFDRRAAEARFAELLAQTVTVATSRR